MKELAMLDGQVMQDMLEMLYEYLISQFGTGTRKKAESSAACSQVKDPDCLFLGREDEQGFYHLMMPNWDRLLLNAKKFSPASNGPVLWLRNSIPHL